ncbi:hypothetical protein KSP39_PZI008650 [Platanthera zijinensis]|uniref:GDSL esterase/lipase n=1 Tax=Platanthera zijinensis TaxID=2320716 RepID=A0AAP0BN10_9ASPA
METILETLLIFAAATPAILPSPDPPSPSPNSRSTALFVLGDSSVNCGDNSVSTTTPPNSSPDLLDAFFRTSLKTGLPPPPPSYSRNLTTEALSTGVNFGSTPATIISTSTFSRNLVGAAASKFLPFQTLNQQIASSIFLLSFARDDYADIFFEDIADHHMYERRGLVRLLVSQMILSIKVREDGAPSS